MVLTGEIVTGNFDDETSLERQFTASVGTADIKVAAANALCLPGKGGILVRYFCVRCVSLHKRQISLWRSLSIERKPQYSLVGKHVMGFFLQKADSWPNGAANTDTDAAGGLGYKR
jgi:hypothetical protein